MEGSNQMKQNTYIHTYIHDTTQQKKTNHPNAQVSLAQRKIYTSSVV